MAKIKEIRTQEAEEIGTRTVAPTLEELKEKKSV